MTKRARAAAPFKDAKTGTWRFVVDLGPGVDRNGRWKQRRQARRGGFATKAEAQAAMDQLRHDARSGQHVALNGDTVADWLAHWLEVVATQVKPSTAAFYRRKARYITDRLGPVRLQQLDPATLTAFYAELAVNGRSDGSGGLSVSTVRHVATVVRMALDAAVEARRIPFNPSMSAKPPSARSVERPEMRWWTAEQLAEFLRAEQDTRYGPAFTFLALTGCRRGEALGLTWADVDLEGAQAVIRRTITAVEHRIHRSGTTKTNRARVIALQPQLVAALRAQKARQARERLLMGPGYADEDLVFCLPDGRPYHPDHFSREFDRRVKRHGVERIRLHDLRHTYAVIALAAGVPVKYVSERLGHASTTITLDLYAHVIPAVEAEHADRVADLILGAAGTEL